MKITVIKSLLSLVLLICPLLYTISAQNPTQENSADAFIAFTQIKKTNIALHTILSSGEQFFIGYINAQTQVEIVPPLLYVWDKNAMLLTIYNAQGLVLAKDIECSDYSASSKGVLILDKSHNLSIYHYLNKELKPANETYTNVKKFKISDNIYLLQKFESSKIETYKLNSDSASSFAVTSQGWNERNNIVTAAFNRNFFVSQDNLTLVNVVNFQGTSIYKGRGNFKSFYLTNNHFIGHYGNGKAEVYNPYSVQVVLSLPQVYSIQPSETYTVFRSENSITIVNDKGEIFPVSSYKISNFSQGETTFSLSEGNEISVFNNSGKIINKKSLPAFSEHNYFGDFICTTSVDSDNKNCFLSYEKNQTTGLIFLESDSTSQINGVHNWGMTHVQYNSNVLNVYLNNGIKYSYPNLGKVFLPRNRRNNDFVPIDF